MPKTRRSRPGKRGTMRIHKNICCEVTYHGLNKWYDKEFEQLGWMILAKDNGLNDKIVNYKSSLMRLKTSIEHKRMHIKEHDRKMDLDIMLHNVNLLISHVDKDFA
jgi:hypothetical protein